MSWERTVWIKWIDSSHYGGWHEIKEHKFLTVENMSCESVGFLIGESEHAIELAQSTTDEEIDNIMVIPKVAILEIRDLSKKRARNDDA